MSGFVPSGWLIGTVVSFPSHRFMNEGQLHHCLPRCQPGEPIRSLWFHHLSDDLICMIDNETSTRHKSSRHNSCETIVIASLATDKTCSKMTRYFSLIHTCITSVGPDWGETHATQSAHNASGEITGSGPEGNRPRDTFFAVVAWESVTIAIATIPAKELRNPIVMAGGVQRRHSRTFGSPCPASLYPTAEQAWYECRHDERNLYQQRIYLGFGVRQCSTNPTLLLT